ncbi:MAG: M1 family metallopeptidase [Vicinamibacteria bacterium]
MSRLGIIATTATVILVLSLPAGADASRRLSLARIQAPAQTTRGGSFEIAGRVRNRGSGRARARVIAHVDGLDQGEAAIARLGSTRVSVRGHRRSRFRVKARMPERLTDDLYTLVVCTKRHGPRGKPVCRRRPLTVAASAFTPGARTLGDPLLPQLGNGGYDARSYEIDLDYDPVPNLFTTATVTINARATQGLSELSLDFQDLPVDSVKVDGVAAGFTQVDATPAISGGGTQPMKLVVTPATGIPDNSEFNLTVTYHGSPQVITDPDGGLEGWVPSPGCPAPSTCNHFVVGEPMGSQAWFPSNNHPSDKATYETRITVPAGQVAVGVGELESQTTSGGSTTWTWSEDDPTASYLVTASNGNFDFVVPPPITEALTGRSLPIYNAIASLALPAQRTAIDTLVGRDKEMIDALGAHYGPYPLDSYGSLWDNLPAVGYALEVQTKSHFSSLPAGPAPSTGLATTYLHELSHQWWGDAVTLEHWNDIWFNEGWAVLSQWIFGFESGADSRSPAEHFDDAYAASSDWSVAPAVLNNDPALLFSPFPVYTRGAMTIEGYREIVGSAAFDTFARSLQSELAFGNISTADFIVRAKLASGFTGAELQLLDTYFQQWLYGTTKPTVTPDDF